MNNITSFDFGAGNLKRYSADGGVVIPSQVAAAVGETLGAVAGLRTSSRPKRISINGYRFYVGNGAHDWGRPIENLDDARFVSGSPELRALVYAVWPAETPQQVIVGLPQSALEDATVGETSSGLKGWLSGVHEWSDDDRERNGTVSRVTISSQAAGALFDYLLDDGGAFIQSRKSHFSDEIGIMSVGMNTLEFLTVRGGKTVNRFTASETAGVRRLLTLIDPQGLYSRGELDTMLRAGQLPAVKGATPIWTSEIAGHVERIWEKRHRRFAAIVVVGGGALLLREELLRMFNGKAFIPDDPVIAVARGLYKLAVMKSR
jgi:hypothetical protein